MTSMNATGTRRTARQVRWLGAIAAGVLLVIGGSAWRSHMAASEHHPDAARANAAAMSSMPGMVMPERDGPGESAGGVRLTAEQMRQFGVTFGMAERRGLSNETRAAGVVTVDSSRLVQVATRFAGYVEHLYVNASGQRVGRGQPLMDVYSPDLVAAEQELLVAASLQRSMGQTEVPGVPSGGPDLVTAARRRLAQWDISEAQITDVLRSGRVRRTLTLFAPASGFVLEKNVVQGQAVQPGQPLYTIADLTSVWVDTQLREMDAASVKPGALALVAASASPGSALAGRVTYVYPTLDPQSRTLRARVSVPNATALLKPGMYVTVTLTSPSRTALVVPASAVLRTGERNIVFVDAGHGSLMPQEVQPGQTAGGQTEILAGLVAGQRVATSAQFLLDAESNLGDVMRSMIGQGSAGSASAMGAMSGNASGDASGDASGRDAPANMSDRGADMRGMPSMAPASPRNPPR